MLFTSLRLPTKLHLLFMFLGWAVTRVVNTYGPQTRSTGSQGEAWEPQKGPAARDCGNAATEERLQNIEAHLKLPSVGPVPLNVFQRLKKLEDRILELEGLSPEYFQSN
ncbi:hypothetical protein GOODEAATRI_008360, partial [Goodea atripinnis]